MFDWLKAGLRRKPRDAGVDRRIRVDGDEEDEGNERFVLIIQLMVVFFLGLLGLEIFHMLVLGTWNEVIYNGIMLVVGSIIGAIWGNNVA